MANDKKAKNAADEAKDIEVEEVVEEDNETISGGEAATLVYFGGPPLTQI